MKIKEIISRLRQGRRIFRSVNLRGADLSSLYRANLRRAEMSASVLPDGQRADSPAALHPFTLQPD